MNKKILVVIGGPTCVGKSETCIKLAKYYDTEIISADSRQFYKELNIGVAKLSKKKLSTVKHYLINNASVTKNYSIGKYITDFTNILNELFKKKEIVFLCGGSGLYIESVCVGLDKIPKIKPGIREKLQEQLKNNGLKNLTDQLKKYDFNSWEKIDLKNPRKVIRSLEIYLSTKKPMSHFLNKRKKERNFDILFFYLNEEREVLHNKINKRVDEMISNGLEKEAKKILELNKKIMLDTIGYKEFYDYFNEKQSLDQTISLIKRNTRRYAKRQITWFKTKKFTEVSPKQINRIKELIEKKKGD
tara:strand:+ start:11895 stop:12800 length:906 start_codon:yes stop_codon:yes gene_type:complete